MSNNSPDFERTQITCSSCACEHDNFQNFWSFSHSILSNSKSHSDNLMRAIQWAFRTSGPLWSLETLPESQREELTNGPAESSWHGLVTRCGSTQSLRERHNELKFTRVPDKMRFNLKPNEQPLSWSNLIVRRSGWTQNKKVFGPNRWGLKSIQWKNQSSSSVFFRTVNDEISVSEFSTTQKPVYSLKCGSNLSILFTFEKTISKLQSDWWSAVRVFRKKPCNPGQCYMQFF